MFTRRCMKQSDKQGLTTVASIKFAAASIKPLAASTGPMHSRFKVLDLFSGIGGFSLGLERAGMQTIAFCEYNKSCQRILRKHWPKVPIYGNVKTLGLKRLKERPNFICGGFPCQDISVLNQDRKGLSGKRSGLWVEYLRLIKEIKPEYALIENVANLRNRGLSRLLKDLWELSYDAEWHIIPAPAISPNAPQKRRRIWILAYPYSDLGERSIQAVQRKRSTEATHLENSTNKVSALSSIGGKVQNQGPQSSGSREIGPRIYPEIWERITSEMDRAYWDSEPPVGRMVARFSPKLDAANKTRLKQLGNSVIPFIPEAIGRCIMKYEH